MAPPLPCACNLDSHSRAVVRRAPPVFVIVQETVTNNNLLLRGSKQIKRSWDKNSDTRRQSGPCVVPGVADERSHEVLCERAAAHRTPAHQLLHQCQPSLLVHSHCVSPGSFGKELTWQKKMCNRCSFFVCVSKT